jgi:hypothetical protein
MILWPGNLHVDLLDCPEHPPLHSFQD